MRANAKYSQLAKEVFKPIDSQTSLELLICPTNTKLSYLEMYLKEVENKRKKSTLEKLQDMIYSLLSY